MEGPIETHLMDYWTKRSNGYSIATAISIEKDNGKYVRIFEDYLNIVKGSKVLDVGCGAGLMSVILSGMGHKVFAVDNNEAMLKKAKENAMIHDADIDFIQADISALPFEDGYFDAVIANNVLWSVVEPVFCYHEMMRVLRPGGFILIMDGNYYLDLFDRTFHKKMLSRGMDFKKSLHGKTNVDGVDFSELTEIAKDLPLSREHRPAWDVDVLSSMGANTIYLESMDDERMPGTVSKIIAPPRHFLLSARKSGIGSEVMSPTVDREYIKNMDIEKELQILKALADHNRMSIITNLLISEMDVTQLTELTSSRQSLVSHNISILKSCNLIKGRREGKHIYYSVVNPESVIRILKTCRHLLP